MKEADSVVKKECAYCGSTKDVHYSSKYGDYLCGKHYQQMNKRGYCYKSIKEPNDYEIIDDKTAYILAYKGKLSINEELCRVIVDLNELDTLLKYKWYIGSDNYARSNSTIGLMHRLIIGCNDKSIYVDHINHDRLDNRKSNLRIVTPQQNCWNSASFKGKSKFKGVDIIKNGKYVYYMARGCLNDQFIRIGTYQTELEAAYAHNLWIIEHFGDYANTNKFTNEEWAELQTKMPLKTLYEHNKEHATSKYKYITRDKRYNCWVYERTINKVRYRKYGFKTEEEAHNAYIERMKEIGVEP